MPPPMIATSQSHGAAEEEKDEDGAEIARTRESMLAAARTDICSVQRCLMRVINILRANRHHVTTSHRGELSNRQPRDISYRFPVPRL